MEERDELQPNPAPYAITLRPKPLHRTLQERDELQLALNEALCASRELVEVRGALAAVEDSVRKLDSVSVLLLEEGSEKLKGVSALFSEFFGNAKGLEATVDALKSECEGLTKRCEALEGELEWERERNACMSAKPPMAEQSLEFDQAEKKLEIAGNGSSADGPSFDRARGKFQDGQQVAESGLGLGEDISNVEQLACEAQVIWHVICFLLALARVHHRIVALSPLSSDARAALTDVLNAFHF
jgi:hypothetical protein